MSRRRWGLLVLAAVVPILWIGALYLLPNGVHHESVSGERVPAQDSQRETVDGHDDTAAAVPTDPAPGVAGGTPDESYRDRPRAVAGTPLYAPASFADETMREEAVHALGALADEQERQAASLAAKSDVPVEGEEDGRAFKLLGVVDGRVYRYVTRNANAAITTAAAAIRQTPPYGLDGAGVTVGVWDAGTVRTTHREFDNRIALRDATAMHAHSTHVAGTVAAAGVDPSAKGMAPAARIDSFDWNNDLGKMAQNAMAAPNQTGKIQVSNHSYGLSAGWEGGNKWYGTWATPHESDAFGMYDMYASMWDTVCYNAPYYLPFVAAGNDRIDLPPAVGGMFSYFDGTAWRTKPYDPATDPPRDGWDQGGYDTIPYFGNAKNILTIGAVNDGVLSGIRDLSRATMTTFSSWGPADDGRIKPDLVGNGASLWSVNTTSDSSYTYLSGTSMAAPNLAGSAALLIELHGRLFSNVVMRASTLKGLLIHTADDLGRPGPDYQFGWGLANAQAAADHLLAHWRLQNATRLVEDRLTHTAREKRYTFLWDTASPIRATLCWTDYPGAARNTLDDRTPALVHDLDLRIVTPGGVTNYPFALDPLNPAAAAAFRDNTVDTVEQVLIASPAEMGAYEIVIRHKGELTTSEQHFSLLLGGSTLPPTIVHTPLQNTTLSTGARTVAALISSESTLDTNRLWLVWTTGADWVTNVLSETEDGHYVASIPAQPLGTRVRYYLQASDVRGFTSTLPVQASAAPYTYEVTLPFVLVVDAMPMELAYCDPPYGAHWMASGVVVRASAAPHTDSLGGFRYRNAGWTGSGSVPVSGATNDMEFVLESDSALTWQWAPEFRLHQTATVPNLLNFTNWWPIGSQAETVEVPELVPGLVARRFYGWYVDNVRWPDADSESVNPARGIAMSVPRTAEARYLSSMQDSDNDGLPDWWELRYFGSLAVEPHMDSDGDGFTNRKEYLDGTNPRDAGSYPTAPSIAHVPLTTVVTTPAPWSVTAVVTDNHSVQSASLRWRRNAGAQQSNAMSLSSTANTYNGVLPAPGVTGDSFVYDIIAVDGAQMQSANGPYAFDVAYPLAHTSPNSFPEQLLPAFETTNLFLSVSNAGHLALSWTADIQDAGFHDDVESGERDWVHEGRNDVWHISRARSVSPSNAWFFGSEALGHYPDNANAALLSPPIIVPGGGRLSYWQWLHTEEPMDATHAWDGCYVEISTNNGASFEHLFPVGGYPYIMFGHSASPFPHGTPCFAGTGGWERVEFDLSAYAEQTVRIGFRFGSDGYVTGQGWYVDDVVVSPYSTAHGWIDLPRNTGVLEPGQTDALPIVLSSHDVPPGETVSAGVRLLCNDPTRPSRVIPISLHNLSRTIRVEQPAHGSIAPSGTLYVVAGGEASFDIAASPYHHIAYVVANGEGTAVVPPTNRLDFVLIDIRTNVVLSAVMAADVTVYDVPLWWLASHELTGAPPEVEAMADHDGDGVPTWAEYVAGTDPTDRDSYFAIRDVQPFGTNTVETVVSDESGFYTSVLTVVEGVLLSWPSASNRIYHLFGANEPHGVLVPLRTNILATPPENALPHTFSTNEPAFFRLGVELQ